MSDPKTTSREQFQNDMLWVRGFTCFNVEGMQIHAKKKCSSKKNILSHLNGASPVAAIRACCRGFLQATMNVVHGYFHREIQQK